MAQPRSRMTAFAAATTAGLLIGLIVQILLAKRGIDLTGVWRDIVANDGLQLRSALAWWSIAGAAFAAAFAIASAIQRFAWLYLRFMKWVLALAGVYFLASIGHGAPGPAAGALGAHLATSLGAFGAALLMASFGAYFAVRA